MTTARALADNPARPTLSLVAPETETETVVVARTASADGVVTLTLGHPEGTALPAWEPGAHVDLLLSEGPLGLTPRQYSLCGDPADASLWRVGVLREPVGRGGSAWIHDELAAGDSLRVRGPRNHFALHDAPRYLFVAGGIGVTPLLPMVAGAETAGADWRLVYGGRTRSSMAYLDELAAYGDRVQVCPQDETGLLDLDALLGVPQDGTLVYCCGPEPLLAAVEQRCAAWPTGSLHVERFHARPADEDRPAARAFVLVLQRSGRTLTVPPERSILDMVEEAGVGVLSSCSEGTCGTCETAVVAGEPDHRDSVLDDDERDTAGCMMICVSRSLGPRLVLDL